MKATLINGEIEEVLYLLDNKRLDNSELACALMNAFKHIETLERQLESTLNLVNRLVDVTANLKAGE